MDARAILTDLFAAAVAAAQPAQCLPPVLPAVPRGRTIVIGAGKASAQMAAQLEKLWPTPLQGVVVTRYGHAASCRQIRIIEAGHPVPDQNSMLAAQAIRAAVTHLQADDLVICLISGGGSALLVEPVAGISLADKQLVTTRLFEAGASIRELNRVRQALSAVKGGQLALAARPARVVTLAISDIPGDDPTLIASGPTVAPVVDDEPALAIVERLGVSLPPHMLDVLGRHKMQAADYSHCTTRLIATPMQSLQAAARRAGELGITPLILGDGIEGEAKETALVHAGIALSAARFGMPVKAQAVLLSGGETRVTFGAGHTGGRGGRNSEFLLAFGIAVAGHARLSAIACDTDGIDGSEDNAGALWLPDSARRARAAGVDLRECLRRHDTYSAFAALGDLVVTGPTGTNVNDFRAVLIGA